MRELKRGQIYYADLSPVVGSEQGGHRPVVIIQNNVGNKFSPTTIIAICTTQPTKANLPTHYWIQEPCGLDKKSMIELEQIRTIDKKRLKSYVGKLSERDIVEVDKAIKISLGI